MNNFYIIIPVYNCADYLSTCLSSVFNQKLSPKKVICINDGSKDNSLNILEDYQKTYSNQMEIISTNNQGPSAARNIGLNCLLKFADDDDLIAFVDADDWIDFDFCFELLNSFKNNNCDIIFSGVSTHTKDKVTIKKETSVAKIINSSDAISGLIFNKFTIGSNKKAFRFGIIKDIRFCDDIMINEDLIFNLYSCLASKHILLIPYCGYHLNRLTSTSITTGNITIKKRYSYLKSSYYLFKFVCVNDFFKELYDYCSDNLCRRFLEVYPFLRKSQYREEVKMILKDIKKEHLMKRFKGLYFKEKLKKWLFIVSPFLYALIYSNLK